MKKIARITLITLATLTLVACGQKENTTKKEESS
ncbi:LPS translocon maturation chaperone LptM, partial [Carnobacterium sp.]